ncbi:MAG TPA: TraB/GumN family protein [Rhodocyclaceae bacterium]|nr:TraB/GumN family protein [Rhodocyclaceae bacterium]
MKLKSMVVGMLLLASMLADAEEGRPLPQEARYIFGISENGSLKGYLFGSNHADFKTNPMVLDPCVKRKISDSGAVYLELDPDTLDLKSPRAKIDFSTSKILMNLSDVARQQIRKAYFGMRYDFIVRGAENIDPMMFLLSLYGANKYLSSLSENSLGGLDRQVSDFAKSSGLQVGSLETLEEQISAIGKVSLADWISMYEEAASLLASEQATREYAARTAKETGAYVEGDEEVLRNIGVMAGPHAAYWTSGFMSRNPVLAERISTNLKAANRPVFFALGAMHLGASGGVVDRLKEAGYAVERICKR